MLRVSMISSLTQNNDRGDQNMQSCGDIGRWRICVTRKLDKAKMEFTQTFYDVLEKIRKEDDMNKFSMS